MSASDEVSPSSLASDEERERIKEVLMAEYMLLTTMLSTVWTASLTRTSIFLITLSSVGIVLGLAAEPGLDPGPFRALAIVVLPLVLFLGIATFVRVVQLQREAIVYITGLNRIRRFFQEAAPGSRPYFVLPTYDDERAIFRSPGTGMSRRPPGRNFLGLIVQMQGIVSVVSAAVAAAFAGLATAPAGRTMTLLVAIAAFVVTLASLLWWWQRSIAELFGSIRPLHPTPPDQFDAPI
jgi:hypothetical protein